MIPEIGHFALWLAFGVALVLGTMPVEGAALGRNDFSLLLLVGPGLLYGVLRRRSQMSDDQFEADVGEPNAATAAKI
jgi:cytochrome c biogenesis factor